MTAITYDEVAKLAEQLSPAEQQALISRLQEVIQHRMLNKDEWQSLLQSITINVPAGSAFSDRREDWYGDDAR